MASTDLYASFAALAANEQLDRDYTVRTVVRPSPVAVIAPHGGGIEPVTSLIAEAIAAQDYSFYAFEGIKTSGNKDLHITSHKFDEPTAIGLLADTPYAIAIHGRANAGDKSTIWLGGRNTALADKIASALENAGFRVATSGHALPGKNPFNVCNRCESGLGVQMEIPSHLRNILRDDKKMFENLCASIREVLQVEWPVDNA